MDIISRRFASVVALTVLSVSVVLAREETTQEQPGATKPSRDELRDKQLDASLEARDIERILGKLKRASDFSKTRISEAAKTTESASAALDRGDSKVARGDAKRAAEMFSEIAKLLEALLAEETPQRLATARNLTNRLAKAERQFAQQFQGPLNPVNIGGMGNRNPNSIVQPSTQGQGGKGAKKEKESDKGEGDQGREKNESQNGLGGEMTAEERREALAERAEQLAGLGRALEDILKSISQSTEPTDKDAVATIEAALKETDLLKAIESMQQASELIRSNKLDDARLSSLDIADRMEIAAQRLDAAMRTIIAPQAEELRKLEQSLAVLRDKLAMLETPAQIAAWHREARVLLDEAEKLGISDKVRDEFLEQMKQAGLGVDGDRDRFNWGLVNDRYAAPTTYTATLIQLQEEVQVRIRTLLLGDITSDTDENTPPKYHELVDRYYKVLTQPGERPDPTGKAAPAEKPKMRNQNRSK